MQNHHLFFDTFYLENFGILALFIFAIGLPLFFVKNKDIFYQTSWSSALSWFYVLPILFLLFALPAPWPLVALTSFSFLASKTFLQMVGIYHRHWFVTINYIFVILTAWLIHQGSDFIEVYYALPMIALFTFILIPIFRNNYVHMVQYISLSLICYSLFGWFYSHGARILYLDKGLYTLIYLYALSEIAIAVCASVSVKFGKTKLRHTINSKIKWEGILVALVITLLAAWGWRRMLPERHEIDWISAGLIALIFSIMGDWTLSIIRKDLGIKDRGVFILGRGDILSRINKVIFVFPVYFYFQDVLQTIKLWLS